MKSKPTDEELHNEYITILERVQAAFLSGQDLPYADLHERVKLMYIPAYLLVGVFAATVKPDENTASVSLLVDGSAFKVTVERISDDN